MFHKQAQIDITDLHGCRSVQQFDALADLMLADWDASGEEVIGDYFKTEYLTHPFNRWSVTAGGIPTSNPNQNSIESYHKTNHYGLASEGNGDISLGVFLNKNIQIQLDYASYYLCDQVILILKCN